MASSWLTNAYRRDKESLRVVAVGVLAYVAPEAAMRLGGGWFTELADPAPFRDRYYILRRKFWRGFVNAVAVATLALTTLTLTGHHVRDGQSWLRILAAIIALTATLARGGWEIQSIDGVTVLERVDRGMYRIGQLGAFALLVLILGW
jgi:hypothetical protein